MLSNRCIARRTPEGPESRRSSTRPRKPPSLHSIWQPTLRHMESKQLGRRTHAQDPSKRQKCMCPFGIIVEYRLQRHHSKLLQP